MKKIFVAFAAMCALSVVAAAQSASFAGTWELDKSKSQMNERMASMLKSQTLTVTQDDKEVKVDRKTEMDAPQGGGPGGGGGGRGMGGGMAGAPNSTYKLDGSDVVTENPRGKMSTKAKLNGGKLEIKTVNNVNFNGNEMTINGSETWELADGGKTLKIKQVRETPNGAMETTMVYNKK
jgi:hypothetical protein